MAGDTQSERNARGYRDEETSSYFAHEPIGTRALRVELTSQSSLGVAAKSHDGLSISDDDFDFPSTAHPGRNLFTFSLFVLLAHEVLGCCKLMSLIISLV